MYSIIRRRTAMYKVAAAAVAVLITVLIPVSGLTESGSVYAAASKKPAKVKLISVKRSGLKITAKWKKAKNAKKYQVYVKAGSASWKLKKTLKKTSFTFSGKEGVAYSFKVRGVNGNKKGSFSTVKKVTIPKQGGEEPQDPEEPEHEKTAMEIAADKVTDQILALPDRSLISEEDREPIEAARRAYNRLPASAKVFVKEETLAILEDAERRLTELPADAVTALIEAFPRPEKMSEKYIDRIQEAVVAYNALTDEQKLMISDETYEKLTLSVERLQVLLTQQANREEANKVSRMIMEYWDPDEITYTNGLKIKDIRAAYNALPDEQKEYVDKEHTLSVLEAAEARYAEIEAEVNSYMVKWPKVTVDGIEFYKAIEEDDRVLLITTDVLLDENGEQIELYFGDTWIWRDSTLRAWLNETWLSEHPVLSDMAVETEITVVENMLAEDKNYIRTNDKVFVLSKADIKGEADIDDEYTNGHSILAGLEQESYTNSEGKTAMVQDMLLPPLVSTLSRRAWTRSPYNWKQGDNNVHQVWRYNSIMRDKLMPEFADYKDNKVTNYGIFNENGGFSGQQSSVQPVMWVDRAKLEQAAE